MYVCVRDHVELWSFIEKVTSRDEQKRKDIKSDLQRNRAYKQQQPLILTGDESVNEDVMGRYKRSRYFG